MATKRRVGPVSSDQLTSSQVIESVVKTPGFKTIDDVTVEETSVDLEQQDYPQQLPAVPDVGQGNLIKGAPGSRAATVDKLDATDYPWVVRFCLLTNQDVKKAVNQARADKAHAQSVTKKSSGWVRFNDVNPELQADLQSITLLAT